MTKPSERRRLHPWLSALLQRRERASVDPPSDDDIDVACAALSGLTDAELDERFQKPFVELFPSIRRVRDAIKRNATPPRIAVEYPWIKPWLCPSATPAPKRGAREAKPSRDAPHPDALAIFKPIPPEVEDAITAISTGDLPALNPDDPESLPKFLSVLKHKAAEATVPATLQRLAEAVVAGSQEAVERSLKFYFGMDQRGGPLVALQQNFGAQGAPSSRKVYPLEDCILAYEAEHEEEGRGEVVSVDERLLEAQEEEVEPEFPTP